MPPAVAQRQRATYEDLLALPENVVGEILDGELHVSPRPALRHSRASVRLTGELHPFDRGRGGPGGWIILHEPELHLGPRQSKDVIVPDLAGWRRERLPRMPDASHLEVAPDWACEVLSPSTAAIDRVKKLHIYARESVRHAWLVDPIARTLEVFRLEAGRWTLLGTWAGPDVVRAEPFEALELDLSLLWED